MNSEEELIMIHETLWFIAIYIQLIEGEIVGGRLTLVVVIHETSVDVNTKYWHHIALELAFPHSLMQFYRESGSSALWLSCADEV